MANIPVNLNSTTPAATGGTVNLTIVVDGSGNTVVRAADPALKANLASPTFTGTPAVPTAIAGTNTTQAASTAFVTTAVATATPDATTATKGIVQLTGDLSGTATAPTVPGLATKAPLASPALTGVPTAPTAAAGTSTTQLATTAFVNTKTAVAGFGFSLSSIQIGTKVQVPIRKGLTVTSWEIISPTSGSIVLDIRKCAVGAYPTTATIAGTDKPTLASAQTAVNTAISWTINDSDIVEAVVESFSGVTSAVVSFGGTRSL